MKNLSLFASIFALCTSTSYAAINCSSLPTCESLGYTDMVADCPQSSEVLKCPFDLTKGKCQRGPAIGDLKYSLLANDHNGWLHCDGRQFSSDSTAKYYKLFEIIGTNFCHKFTSKTDTSYGTSNCQSGMFALPDYRGFFLRAAFKKITPSSQIPTVSGGTSTTTYYSTALGFTGKPYSDTSSDKHIFLPWAEELPNIRGCNGSGFSKATGDNITALNDANSPTNSFYKAEKETGQYLTYASVVNTDRYSLCFDASRNSSIYQNGAHVIPASYSAHIFIYAGK